MLEIHGVKDDSAEYAAAEKLAKFATNSFPSIENETQLVLHIFPSIQCFGQKCQDIDLLIMFADYRENRDDHSVHSFCTTIEVKGHPPRDVKFEGAQCIVTYNGQDHDVTNQSEKQKYSVKKYIENNISQRAPFIYNLIWLTSVGKRELPKQHSNILGINFSWEELCEKILLLTENKNEVISTFSNRNYLNNICNVFSRRLEPSKIDRKRLEAITKSVLDRSQQQYAEKLGKQLLIYKGRGGTGKTVRLIQTAFQAYNEMGLRVVLLTYNKALVADLRRLLALLGVKDAIGSGSMAIMTIHSFMREWLLHLTLEEEVEMSQFLLNYEQYKSSALEYIQKGLITKQDIQEAKISESKSLSWDLLLIDESQDWPSNERDLIYALYGFEKVIIADGVDQFVRSVESIDWRENIDRSKSQIVPLRKSLRLKSSLCQAVGYFANQIQYTNWNLEPLPESHGGKVIVVIGNAFSENFHKRLLATAKEEGNRPIDLLSCVPPAWVRTTQDGTKYSLVAEQFRSWGWQVWDGVNLETREEYPTSLDQYRIVQYESCRGLEGWIVVNYGLDEFFDYKASNPKISEYERNNIFFDSEESSIEYAKKWLMIPLTRAIDTLVLHVTDENSYVGKMLIELHFNHPETVKLHRF